MRTAVMPGWEPGMTAVRVELSASRSDRFRCEVRRPVSALLGLVWLARLLYFAAVLLASDQTLDADLRALVSEVALLVLADLLLPDLLVVVRVRRGPLVGAVAVVELLVPGPEDAHRVHPRNRWCRRPAGT